jgi:hypothetical protein
MTVLRAFVIILVTGSSFGVAGAVIGFLLGTLAPGYYSAMFRMPLANEPAIGVGLGLTQGLVAGLVVGCLVVLAVAIASRRPFFPSLEPRLGPAWTTPPRGDIGDPTAVQKGPRR